MIGTVNLATTCVPLGQMVKMLLAPVGEPLKNSCRMSRVLLISLLQPAIAMVTCRGKPSRNVCVNTNVASWAVGHCEEFDPVLVPRAKMEEKDFIDKMGVCDVVPRSDAAERGCRVIRTRWVTVNKGSDDALQLRAGWVAQEFRGRCGDKHEYFSETPNLAW